MSRKLACLAVSGMLAAFVTVITQIGSAVPASATTCLWHVHGKPGLTSFTLHVDQDSCGLPIRASMMCQYIIPQDPPNPPYVYYGWVHGGAITGSRVTTSRAFCGYYTSGIFRWGYDIKRNGKWTYHQLGAK